MADSSSKPKKSIAHHIEQSEISDSGVSVSDETFRNIDRSSTAGGPREPADKVMQAEASSAVSVEMQQQKIRGATMKEELGIPDERETQQVSQPSRDGKG